MGERYQSPVNARGLWAVEGTLQTAGCPAGGKRLKCSLLSCHRGEGQGYLVSCHGTTEGPEAASKGQREGAEGRSPEEVAGETCR